MKNKLLLIAFIFLALNRNGNTAQLFPTAGFCPALFDPTTTCFNCSEVEAWIKNRQQVKLIVRRTVFPKTAKAAIKERLIHQNGKKLSELKERVANAYDNAYTAFSLGMDLDASAKLEKYKMAIAELDAKREILAESLPSQIKNELARGSYETQQAQLGPKVRFFEVAGVIGQDSDLLFKQLDEKTGKRIIGLVPYVESIFLFLENGQSALISANDVQYIRPIP